MEFNEILLLIMILSPLIGALLSWPLSKLLNKSMIGVGIITISLSAITSLIAVIRAATDAWTISGLNYTWIMSTVELGLIIKPDTLSLMMAVVASFLGLLIAIFSIEYMSDDDHLVRYWFYLQVFIAGMIILVVASDLVTMYIGWEMVGLCSFGLISHWHNKSGEQGRKAGLAGIKAFVFTRIGDIGFLVAIVILYQELGTVTFTGIIGGAATLSQQTLSVISWMFLAAAFGKSAQFPFIPWLSSPESVDIDAMQGPTTVSALIHAATMVKAGIYLISRVFLILPLWQVTSFVNTLVILSGVTALIAALSALVSFDLKRILAYSTVSQLAYMFLALGFAFLSQSGGHAEVSGQAFMAAQVHLVSHAIFKSLLFLTAGYLIHETGTRRIDQMPGSAAWSINKIGFIGLVVGGLALAGIPPLNGFFSKEAVIGNTLLVVMEDFSTIALLGYLFGVITALVTAAYVGRMFFYMLKPSAEEYHLHKASLMPIVIGTLSALAIVGGLFVYGIPSLLETVIDGSIPLPHSWELVNMIALILIIPLVIWISYKVNEREELKQKVTSLTFSRAIIHASSHGFYLEDVWMGGWKMLSQSSYKLRRTHSGNLNDMVIYATLIALSVFMLVVGDIL